MASNPTDGLGLRLAKYRTIAGYSARELAELAGFGLTRGVIANIESGRKTDITVNQLVALSAVLSIPPVALAMPIETPYAWVRLNDSQESIQALRAVVAMDWFQGWNTIFKTPSELKNVNASTHFAVQRIIAVRDYFSLKNDLDKLRAQQEAVSDRIELLRAELHELADGESQLRELEDRKQMLEVKAEEIHNTRTVILESFRQLEIDPTVFDF